MIGLRTLCAFALALAGCGGGEGRAYVARELAAPELVAELDARGFGPVAVEQSSAELRGRASDPDPGDLVVVAPNACPSSFPEGSRMLVAVTEPDHLILTHGPRARVACVRRELVKDWRELVRDILNKE